MKNFIVLLITLCCTNACQTFQQVDCNSLSQKQKDEILMRWMNEGKINWKYEGLLQQTKEGPALVLN